MTAIPDFDVISQDMKYINNYQIALYGIPQVCLSIELFNLGISSY